MLRIVLIASCLGAGVAAAQAEDLSPLFGNEGQEEFQLAVSGANDMALVSPITTGSVNALPENGAKSACSIEDCNVPVNAVKAPQ